MKTPKKNQSGVILITTIIFLLLILGLLRVTLGTTNIMQKKTGADIDITLATENAYSLLRRVERDKLLVPKTSPELASNCTGNDDVTKGCLDAQRNASKAWWEVDTHVNSTDGYYIGTEQYDTCGGKTGKPLWKCVHWGNKFRNNNVAPGTGKPSIEGEGGRYIVERFTAKDLGITGSDSAIILRVTTLGYGKAADGENPSYVMYEANYLLD